MVQNPDDVSGASEQENSDMDESGGLESRVFDSDEDEDENGTTQALHEDARVRRESAADEDEDDEDGELAPPVHPRQMGGTMDRYLMPKVVAAKKATPIGLGGKNVSKRSSKAADPVPVARKGSSNGAAAPKAKPKEVARTFTPHSDESEDDDDGPAITTTTEELRNPGYPLPAHDCIAEFEQQRTSSLPSGGAPDTAPKVHASAQETVYAMKNEKTNHWWHVPSELLLHAPDNRKATPLEFTPDELVITSTPLRKAMQKKLCDDNIAWMGSTALIFKLPVEGKLDVSLADSPGIVMAIPYTLKSEGTEYQDLRNKLAVDGTPPDSVVGLLALDRDAVKMVYANSQQLPSTFDPLTKSSPCTKWKHVSKLEDYFGKKSKWDLGAPGSSSRGSKATPKRANESAGGSGSGGSKGDGKRQATVNGGSEPPQARAGEVAHVAPTENGHADRPSPPPMNAFATGVHGVSYLELACNEDQMYKLVKAGPGKWLLLKCLES
jgi:hypothetical protein